MPTAPRSEDRGVRLPPLPTPAGKRAFDVLLSGTGLLVSSPIWLALAIAVKLEDSGPVFYSQDRAGKDGEVFRAWKFRSMVPDAEKHVGAIQATEHDPRVTRIGRVMRATAMDELPQLWNIFVGDMSFVGPRAPATRRDRGARRRPSGGARRGAWLRRAEPRATGAHRRRADLRAARHHASQQVPVRPAVHRPPELLARCAAGRTVVLDYVPREVGGPHQQDLSAERAIPDRYGELCRTGEVGLGSEHRHPGGVCQQYG